MRKSNKKGFTLVELVVVIAIIGVLAAILILTMMNYVKKSRMRTANSNAKLVFEQVNNMASDKVADGDAVKKLGPTGIIAVKSYKGSSNALEAAVWDALKDNGESGAGFVAIEFDPNKKDAVNWCQWQTNETEASQITGQWPNAPKDVDKAEGLTFGKYNAAVNDSTT